VESDVAPQSPYVGFPAVPVSNMSTHVGPPYSRWSRCCCPLVIHGEYQGCGLGLSVSVWRCPNVSRAFSTGILVYRILGYRHKSERY